MIAVVMTPPATSAPHRDDVLCRYAARALADHGGGLGDLVFIRRGTNAVFRVGSEVIIRVTPPDVAACDIHMQRALARWLVAHGFPTSAPIGDVHLIEGHVVTLWEYVPGRAGEEADRGALGRLVRHWHDLTDAYWGALPRWDPTGRLMSRLDGVACDQAFTPQDRALLRAHARRLDRAVADVPSVLGWGPIHGDVHAGNAIVGAAGPSLIDLDRVAIGPREWDLTQALLAPQRFGARSHSAAAFLCGYGCDAATYPAMDDLVQLRALHATTWLLTLPRTPRVCGEIARRMAHWRGASVPPAWRPL